MTQCERRHVSGHAHAAHFAVQNRRLATAGRPPPRLADGRLPRISGGARPRRHQGQQARGRRRHPARAVPAGPAVVARRPRAAPGHPLPVRRDRPGRRLVRGSRRPPLQPADPARARRHRRPADAAPIISMIRSSKSTTTRGPASPAAAAPCSSMWRGPDLAPTAGCVAHAGARPCAPAAAARTETREL